MSTITTVMEPHPDGTLHLPVPPEMAGGPIRITATLERAGASSGRATPAAASPEMLQRREAALNKLRQLDPFREIADACAWQKEVREDRPIAGRE